MNGRVKICSWIGRLNIRKIWTVLQLIYKPVAMPINQRHKKQTENTNHKLGDKNCKDPNYKD